MGSRCGEAATCACSVIAGTGIAVTGSGTPASPFVVALSEALATVLNVTDSATVDLARTGTGSAGDPYVITAAVQPGTVTPATNPTLDIVGAKVVDPLEYDASTRETGLKLSADAGNVAALGTDGGLLVEAIDVGGAASFVEPLQDFGSGYIGLLLSGDAGNKAVLGTDNGLFVPTPAPVYTWVSSDAGNQLRLGSEGDRLLVPQPWDVAVVDNDSPLDINVGGLIGSVPAVALPGYTPTIGDYVYALPYGGHGAVTGYLVLGLAPTP